MGEKDLIRYRLCIAVFIILLSAAVMPSAAVVTKETLESITHLPAWTEISPGVVVVCDNLYMDTNTLWWKDSMVWRRDIDEVITGSCGEGISFECTIQTLTTPKNAGIFMGICRFSYPDGSVVQKVFHRTSVKGETRADFERWN